MVFRDLELKLLVWKRRSPDYDQCRQIVQFLEQTNLNNGTEKLEFMDTEISENWRERPQATFLSSSPVLLPMKM